MREYWYNDVSSDTIGKPICPSYYGEEGDGTLELATNQHLDERYGKCPEQLASYPDENAISDQYTQTGGSLICDSHADIEFKIYK